MTYGISNDQRQLQVDRPLTSDQILKKMQAEIDYQRETILELKAILLAIKKLAREERDEAS